MASTAFTLTGETLATLDRVGLRLPGLRQTRRLAAGSRIEAPTSIISTVAPGAFLDVGAFCNLSGGTINNVRFGRYCSVASGVVIGPHEHPTDWLTTSRVAYYPEVNPLVALESTAVGSNCPVSKAVIVRLVPAGTAPTHSATDGLETGQDDAKRSDVTPHHLS